MTIPTNLLMDLDKQTLIELVVKLSTELDLLQARLSKNSSNSSKPPSSDGLAKPKPKPRSLRKKGLKATGGQVGHKGTTLSQVANPNITVELSNSTCISCNHDLTSVLPSCVERRQVFDIPKPQIEITEYVSSKKCCPNCSANNSGSFPDHVKAPVQYGARIRAMSIYMLYYQMIPESRLAEAFADIHGINICSGTLGNSWNKIYDNLEVHEQSAEVFLATSNLAHFDESGMRVGSNLQWLHCVSNESATVYKVDPKRGSAAMDKFHVHKNFTGIAVHDHWKSSYDMKKVKGHALCNAHILRELIHITENTENKDSIWTDKMEQLLYKVLNYVSAHREDGFLPQDYIAKLDREYDIILAEATKHYDNLRAKSPYQKVYVQSSLSSLSATLDKDKKQKISKAPKELGEALALRMSNYKNEILRFMHDFNVPFTNNLSERDIRMIKVRQKISGCFRTEMGAKVFCRIRGYLSTVKKQSLSVIEQIANAIEGRPFVFA